MPGWEWKSRILLDSTRDRTTMTEAALARFQRELSDATQQLTDSLSAVRKAAADILSQLVQRECEGLRRLETQAAVVRAELVSVAGWWPDATLGAIKLPQVTSSYLEMMPAWQDQPAVRTGGTEARQRPWKVLFAKLVQGDAASLL